MVGIVLIAFSVRGGEKVWKWWRLGSVFYMHIHICEVKFKCLALTFFFFTFLCGISSHTLNSWLVLF